MRAEGISPDWRALHAERLREVESRVGSIPGVRGLVLGGSVGRGEHWPLSDIDILPVFDDGGSTEELLDAEQAKLVDWWAASGRAQTLDMGWLRFTTDEVRQAVSADAAWAAGQMNEPRWLHGMDKAYGGRGIADAGGLATALRSMGHGHSVRSRGASGEGNVLVQRCR